MKIIPYLCTMTNYSKTNLNYKNSNTIKLIKSLVKKGDILNWHQPIQGHVFKDNKGKFKITSVKLNPWGSIYINLRLIKSRYFNEDLSTFLTQSTGYRNKKNVEEFKYLTLKFLVHKQLKLVGYEPHTIFIKRLYI